MVMVQTRHMAFRQHAISLAAWLVGSILLLAITLPGCGKPGPKRYHLAGNITWGGQPVPAGIVYFDPDLAAGHDGPQGFAPIKNGNFDTRLEGLGQGGGKYVLRLYAYDGMTGPELPMGKPLFPLYTTAVDLPTEDGTRDFDVPKEP